MNQSELEESTCNRRIARENECKQVTIDSLFLLIGRENSARCFDQSQSEIKQILSKR